MTINTDQNFLAIFVEVFQLKLALWFILSKLLILVILYAFLLPADFFLYFKSFIFQKIFHEFHQNIKQFGSRSGPMFCMPDLVSNCLQRLLMEDTTKQSTYAPVFAELSVI